MAAPPMWLLPLLGGAAGGFKGYQDEKTRQRKEQEERDAETHKARLRGALQEAMDSSLSSPSLRADLFSFLSQEPQEREQGKMDFLSRLAGQHPSYGPAAAEANRTLKGDADYQGMGIPEFLGNPLLRGAAVAHLADHGRGGTETGRTVGRAGTPLLMTVMAKAEAETTRNLSKELSSIEQMVGGEQRDQALERLAAKRLQYMTSNFMRHFNAAFSRPPTFNETQKSLGDRFDEATFQNQASMMLRQAGGALPPGQVGGTSSLNPSTKPPSSGISFTN